MSSKPLTCQNCKKFFTPWKNYERTPYLRYIGCAALRWLAIPLHLCVQCRNKARNGELQLPDKFQVRAQ